MYTYPASLVIIPGDVKFDIFVYYIISLILIQ